MEYCVIVVIFIGIITIIRLGFSTAILSLWIGAGNNVFIQSLILSFFEIVKMGARL